MEGAGEPGGCCQSGGIASAVDEPVFPAASRDEFPRLFVEAAFRPCGAKFTGNGPDGG